MVEPAQGARLVIDWEDAIYQAVVRVVIQSIIENWKLNPTEECEV